MNTVVKASPTRVGKWLSHDVQHVDNWIRKLKQAIADQPREWVPPIRDLYAMVYDDPPLYANVCLMFAQAYTAKKRDPLGQPEIKTFEEFLDLLNAIMTTAPECYQTGRGADQEPAGMIGFPINALLDWPMGTGAGYAVFSNALINQQFKKILSYWAEFLVKPESRYVLIDDDKKADAIAWLSSKAQSEMVSVACAAVGEGKQCSGTDTFASIFQCNPDDKPYYGFQSWDDFFTRQFVDGVRPVSSPDDDNVIVNACESAPFTLQTNVQKSANFWLKNQPYSLENMLNWDPDTDQFVGGTVYQAFLSALSYHRWHSPVNGTIRKAYVVNGSYYLENLYQGFRNPHGADSAGPNNSQPFLTAVATRALIFIEADNPKIGLMCVMPVGMAEVSSCEISVKEGQRVKKGDELGMFHFGGSTHCLIFRPETKLHFELYGQTPGPNAETNIRINTKIATVIS